MLTSVTGIGATLYPVSTVSPANCKDSYYFVGPNGVKYLAVTDLGFNGTTLLVSNNGSDSSYGWYNQTLGGGNYAPCVIQLNGTYYFFTVQWNSSDYRQCYINEYTYDIPGGAITNGPNRLNIAGGGAGLEDPEIFQDHGKWYLLAGQWTQSQSNVHLVWAVSSSLLGPYSVPQDLLDSSGNRVDYDLRGSAVGYIVEAPRWSFWTHEIYWSIGPSVPKNSDGSCNMLVKAVRRGTITWYGDTPIISVIGPTGGADDIMASNMDCYHLTHPDFQSNGYIRATSMSNNQFYIVNVPAQ
jgi:hypothetical protein